MAKISLEFDTKEKSFALMLDGKAVENVVGAYLSKDYYDEEKFRCEIMTASHDEENDIHSITRLVASESEQGKAGDGVQSADHPEFVTVAQKISRLQKSLSGLFQSKPKG